MLKNKRREVYMTNKTLRFSVSDIQDISHLDDIDQSQFSLLRVACFSTGVSAHDTEIDEETLRRTSKSILQKPFVFEYDLVFDDMGTHSEKEIAGGFVPHNSDVEFSYLDDGRLMMYVDVLIWKRYSQDLVRFFQRDGNRKSVSVEIEIFESEFDEATGITKIIDFAYTCITGLGDMVSGAIENAEAVMVFSKEYEKDKADFQKFSRYSEIDFKVPDKVLEACRNSLDTEGFTSTSKALAKHLIKHKKINPSKVKFIYKMYKNENSNATTKMLGSEGKKWILSLFKSISEADENNNYFAENTKDKEENMAKEVLENAKPEKEEEDVMMAEESEKEEMAEEESEDKEEMAQPEEKEEMAEPEEKEEMAEPEEKEEMAEPEEEEKEEEFMLENMLPMEMAERLFSEDQMKSYSDKDVKATVGALISVLETMEAKFAKIEEKEKEVQVTQFIAGLGEKVVFSDDDIKKLRESSEKYALSELDAWKNECKSYSFDLKSRNDNADGESVSESDIFALHYMVEKVSPNKNDVWADFNK
jgi:hypothetical protein